ncbi:hypothetical protein TNCV_257861 [Trichonephila clavipes]|uniref:Uncharacterized protein n=1 Tax=Trichonephila clavipes TaxID=2585209 RepID=A0A8X6S3A0_TRICX|nr:hypothetical protein TNCV_257861 [Trichonephila clavipes]
MAPCRLFKAVLFLHARDISMSGGTDENARSLLCTWCDFIVKYWRTWPPNLSPIENILSGVAEKLACHPFPANKVDEVGYRLEIASNELLIHVIQTQFDSMPNRVRVILASRSGY